MSPCDAIHMAEMVPSRTITRDHTMPGLDHDEAMSAYSHSLFLLHDEGNNKGGMPR